MSDDTFGVAAALEQHYPAFLVEVGTWVEHMRARREILAEGPDVPERALPIAVASDEEARRLADMLEVIRTALRLGVIEALPVAETTENLVRTAQALPELVDTCQRAIDTAFALGVWLGQGGRVQVPRAD